MRTAYRAISVLATCLANTDERRPVKKDLSRLQPVAPGLRILLFSGPPAQTVAGLRIGESCRRLVRGGTQGNALRYRWPFYDARP